LTCLLLLIPPSTQVSKPFCGSKLDRSSGDFFYEQLSIPSLEVNEISKNCSWSFENTPEEAEVLHIRFALIIKIPIIILPDGSSLSLKNGRNDLLRPLDFYYSINSLTTQCKKISKKMTLKNLSIVISSNKMTRLYGFYEFLCGRNCTSSDCFRKQTSQYSENNKNDEVMIPFNFFLAVVSGLASLLFVAIVIL